MYLQLWDTECQAKAQLVGHTERACDVAFHPQSGLGQSLSAVRVVRPVCNVLSVCSFYCKLTVVMALTLHRQTSHRLERIARLCCGP